ncbi:TIGR00268 family protein [Streptomyces sp. NPDC007325]|uniref:TIGR00268 family protein n=1 Tax=Streptomyces sp. NPDC007325 TaxID=3154588 RepID=UPI0033EC0F90
MTVVPSARNQGKPGGEAPSRLAASACPGGAPDSARALVETVGRLGSLVVAFSGGVDSTVVLAAAVRGLGEDRVVAAIADSPALARAELEAARATAAAVGSELVVLDTDELSVRGYRANAGNRCYFCKRTVLSAVSGLRDARGFAHIATGTHLDDRRAGHRPGLAAAREAGVVEPLADTGLTKADVREIAEVWGLAVADKPGMPCLASRVAVGVPVTRERLALVERAEEVARACLGRHGIAVRDLRVRLLADGFRAELDERAYAWLGRRPREADGLVRELAAALPLGVGTLAPYRSGSVSTPAALEKAAPQ